MVEYLKRDNKPNLAFAYTQGKNNTLPAVMFLGGFCSDMEGTKAVFLEQQCKNRGQSFLRFDYSAHGSSEGDFKECTIGDWLEDAQLVLKDIITGPVILVGSSMGGWISLLLAQQRPENIRAIIGLAAAPDFTNDIESMLNEGQWQDLDTIGFIEIESEYSNEPYLITKPFLDDGRRFSLLNKKLSYPCPIVLIHGMKDTDVPWQAAFRLKNAITGAVEVILIETADHRLSSSENLALIDKQIYSLSGVKSEVAEHP